MLTITAAAAAITGYLTKSLKENKSIANFFTDFTDASVAWIRPVFLKEDGTEKKIVKDLTENPDDTKLHDKVKTLIEDRAEDDDNALQLLTDMVAKIVEKTGQNFTTHGDNSKIVGGNDNSVNNSHNTTNSNNTTTHNDNSTHQTHHGSGDIVGRDQITHHNYAPTDENRSDLDTYNIYLDTAVANQKANTSQPIVGKKVIDLDTKTLDQFWQLDRVKAHLLQQDLDTNSPIETRLRALRLMTNGYVVKGTFLCMANTMNASYASGMTDIASFGVFDTLDKFAVRSSEQIYGNLIEQYQTLLRFITKELAPLQIIDLQERVLDYSIPLVVIQELLANAFVHRDYDSPAPYHIWVDMFPDRIEIYNAGQIPHDIDLSKPDTIVSHLVNKEIARIFFLYRFIELRGGGIQRVQTLLRKRQMHPAIFQNANGFVKVTVYKRNK